MSKEILVVIDENRQTPQDRLAALEKRYRWSVRRNTAAFGSLLVASILSSGLPAVLVQVGDSSSGKIKDWIIVAAIIAALLSLLQAAVGTRKRWHASRTSEKRVIQLSNTYASGTMSPEVAMQQLNEIVEKHDAAVQASVIS
jgi:HAMP domain-containing protein